MCEPATIAAIGTWVASAAGGTAAAAGAGAAAAGTAAAAGAGAAAAGLTTAQMVALGLSAAGTITGTAAAYQQSQTAKAVAESNAKTAEIQAQDATRRGELEAQAIQRKGAAMQSEQRAIMAARGLDLAGGTAGDILDQTAFFTSMDAQTARQNASKEAWGRRSQGANFTAEANAQKPWLSAGGTFLSGAGQVADRWSRFSTPSRTLP